MANLLDRIKNVFEDEMLTSKEASSLAHESVRATRNNRHSLDATEKISTRGEIATEWLTSLKRGHDPELAQTFAEGRISQYNKTAPSGQRISVDYVHASVNGAYGRLLAEKQQAHKVSNSEGMAI